MITGYNPGCGAKGNALFLAVMNDNQTIVKLLIGAGARLDFTLHGGSTSISWGWVPRTPLQIAKKGSDRLWFYIFRHL